MSEIEKLKKKKEELIPLEREIDLAKDDPELLPLVVPATFGIGLQTYEKKKKKRKFLGTGLSRQGKIMAKEGHDCPFEGWAKGKLEDIRDDVKEIKQDVKAGFKDHNGRLRGLEVWRGYIIGITVGVGAIVTLIVKLW